MAVWVEPETVVPQEGNHLRDRISSAHLREGPKGMKGFLSILIG